MKKYWLGFGIIVIFILVCYVTTRNCSAQSTFIQPCDGQIIFGFGQINPSFGNQPHLGEDYGCSKGTRVRAIADGTIGSVWLQMGGYGGFASNGSQLNGPVFYVKYKLKDGSVFYAQYGHTKPFLSTGAQVLAGDEIGEVSTYRYQNGADGSHLHFGIWKGENPPSTNMGYGTTRQFVRPSDFLRNNKPFPFKYDYIWLKQSSYPTVKKGGTATLWLNLKNAGTETWNSRNFHLGTCHPRDRSSGFYSNAANSGWLSTNRISLQQSSVRPNETGNFQFTIYVDPKKVVNTGNYREYFCPVVDGVGWIRDVGIYWDINVIK